MKQKELHKRYIKGTAKKALVKELRALLCHLGKSSVKVLNNGEHKVYIKTRVLKHLYDKRSAEEYNFILEYLIPIIKNPDKIYKNKAEKRGDFAFYKVINNRGILCSLELNETDRGFDVATVFTGKNLEKYLKNFKRIHPITETEETEAEI